MHKYNKQEYFIIIQLSLMPKQPIRIDATIDAKTKHSRSAIYA